MVDVEISEVESEREHDGGRVFQETSKKSEVGAVWNPDRYRWRN